MKKLALHLFISIVFIFGISIPVIAEDELEDPPEEVALTPSVVINEVQTNGLGSGTSNEEFIELVNISLDIVDITNWTLEYVNTAGNSSVIYTFGLPSPFIEIEAGEYLLGICEDAPTGFLADISPTFEYSNCLAASGAGLVLKDSEETIVDSLYWVSGPDSYSEDIVPLLDKGWSIQRRVVAGLIVATGNNIENFEALEEPTPQTGEFIPPDDEGEEEQEEEVQETSEEEATEEQEEVEEAGYTQEDEILLPILLNELYIDPADPLTDSQDEWVEIYNPNNQAVDLEDYIIYTGSTFSYKHSFSAGDVIAPSSYMIITSGESSLALSNSGGKAKVMGPNGQVFDETSYAKASNGMSWAKTSSGVWSWSSTPTKSATNIITAIPVKIKTASSTTKKSSTKKTSAKTTKSTSVKASTTDENISSLVDAPGPLPNWLLVTLGSLAVLYCLYEYRFELQNKIYQFKQYRTNRR